MSTLTVGLVACAAQKLQRPAPARDLYVSQLFRKASAYAEASCDRWYILSAKHGLVRHDTIFEPYDVRLKGAPASASVRYWAAMVRGQLDNELAGLNDVVLVVLAGRHYRSFLECVPWPHEIPMDGMGIGQQLGWLNRNGPTPASP